MESTTESASMSTETKEGVHIKGKDVIFLDAPEVLLSKDTPLLTDAQDVAGAINELFSYGAGGGDDWQPPGWWIPVPEPGPYDIYILILATKDGRWNNGMRFALYLCRESDGEFGHGHVHCDWGDGTENDYYESGNPEHTYIEEGQYLIHIVTDENSNGWGGNGSNQAEWQIVKAGKNIVFATDYNEQINYYPQNMLPNKNKLKYMKVMNSKGLRTKKEYVFQGCNALRKLEIEKKFWGNLADYAFQNCYGFDFSKILNEDEINSVGNYVFQWCSNLKSINLPNVTSVGNGAFSYCYNLTTVYLPSCTYIDAYAFQNCYNLQEIVVAEDCTFGTNCFQNCPSLYPRPDGSVN